MDYLPFAAAPCAECRRYAEPPFTPLHDLFGGRTKWVVCLDCYDRILHPDAADPEDGEQAGRA